jgi:hypothetical protein
MTQTDEQTQAEATAETPQESVALPPVNKAPLLQLWFHNDDLSLLETMNPFFTQVQRRLPSVGFSLFRYTRGPVRPKPIDQSEYFLERQKEDLAEYEQKKQAHQKHHQEALVAPLAGLERTVLFVPCISPAFLEAFDGDLASIPQLAQTLAKPHFHIMPIVTRPVESGPTFSSRPLCTYAEGHERETALKEFIALVERILCDTLQIEPHVTALDYLFCSPNTVQPVIASQATPMDRILEMLQPVQTLLEQASAQIVESRQLAIAERSEHQTVETLESQIEALRQQVQAQSSGFWSRFRKKQS